MCFANPSDILLCPLKYTTPSYTRPSAVTQEDDFFFFERSSLLIFRSTEHQNDISKGRRTKFDVRLKVFTGRGKTFSEYVRKVIWNLLRICSRLTEILLILIISVRDYFQSTRFIIIIININYLMRMYIYLWERELCTRHSKESYKCNTNSDIVSLVKIYVLL